MELQKNSNRNKLSLVGLREEYAFDVRQFNRFIDGRFISQDLIKEYFNQMKKDGKSPSTISRHKASIKQAIIKMTGQGVALIQKAQIDFFFREIKAGKRDIAISKESILTEKEMIKLLKVSGQKTKLLIKALYQTAARVSELSNIRLSDCQVRKEGVIIRIVGKRNKEGTFYMSIDLFQAIRDTYKGKIYLFECNDKAISRMTVYTLIKRAGTKIGRQDISPHTLRHSWASLSIDILGLAKVSGYLRHASQDTTAKYYLHGKAEMPEILAVNTLKLAI